MSACSSATFMLNLRAIQSSRKFVVPSAELRNKSTSSPLPIKSPRPMAVNVDKRSSATVASSPRTMVATKPTTAATHSPAEAAMISTIMFVKLAS